MSAARIRWEHMYRWLVVSVVLLLIDLLLSRLALEAQPNAIHLAVHKADMVTWGAWLGWIIDRAIDPDNEPDEMRRGLIIAAAILAFALGL